MLRHDSSSKLPTDKLIGTCKICRNGNMRFITIDKLPPPPPYTEGQMAFFHSPSATQMLSPKLHFFQRGPRKMKKVIIEKTYKLCERDINKKLIVPYDPVKPSDLSPGDFVPPMKNPPTSMKPTSEFPSNTSLAKCLSRFSQAQLSSTPTTGTVPTSALVLTVQRSTITASPSPPIASDNDHAFPAPLQPGLTPLNTKQQNQTKACYCLSHSQKNNSCTNQRMN